MSRAEADYKCFHFFEHDNNSFAFRIYDDVVKVYPVKQNGTLHLKDFIEIANLTKSTLIKAAIELLSNPRKPAKDKK